MKKMIVIFAMVLFMGACSQGSTTSHQLPVFATEPGGRALTPEEWQKWRAARAADPAYQQAAAEMRATPRYKESVQKMQARKKEQGEQ